MPIITPLTRDAQVVTTDLSSYPGRSNDFEAFKITAQQLNNIVFGRSTVESLVKKAAERRSVAVSFQYPVFGGLLLRFDGNKVLRQHTAQALMRELNAEGVQMEQLHGASACLGTWSQ